MCRFAAYIGPKIPLERIVMLPDHSLLAQSQNATEAKLAVNGDGFGVAWYADQEQPGLYRDVFPAWSDGNLPDICRMIRSHLFLAHVRASTTGATSRQNCHPFRYGRWSFMHNGQLGGFSGIRRQLEQSLPNELFDAKQGSTDSELLFLLMLANGLNENANAAICKTLRAIPRHKKEPHRITCALSDGKSIYAFRYSTDRRSPTLYVGKELDAGGSVIASEPLENNGTRWTAIPDGTLVSLSQDELVYDKICV